MPRGNGDRGGAFAAAMTAGPGDVACGVCAMPCGPAIYREHRVASITSTAEVVDAPTAVFACSACGHVQTAPLENVDAYYGTGYNVHLDTDAADDLYAVRDGVPVYRAQHQATVALEKLQLAGGASVLDYGCGKGMTLRAMLAARPDFDGAVFDVSDAYRGAWDAFVPRARQAAFEPPVDWDGRFDAVLSFFALEHAVDPRAFVARLARLVKPGGSVHVVIPNVRRNAGDFIVVDHVNHFMPTSLRVLLVSAGFDAIGIDEESHTAAYVITATRPCHAERGEGSASIAPSAVAVHVAEAHALAAFWTDATESVRRFEREVARERKAAIYGSGFYGVFIASRLASRSNVAYVLDRNPHQHGKRILGLPVVAPDALGDDVDVIYAGLNPAIARDVIASVEPVRRRPRDAFFLDGPRIAVRPVGAGEWQLWRALRLAALRDAPGAFGATLAEWQGAGDTEPRWRARLTEVPFNAVVLLDGVPSGIASGTAPDASNAVDVISMWIAPDARGVGCGDALVEAVVSWASAAGASCVQLSVVETNERAKALYRRRGFIETGPSPESEPGRAEVRMTRRLRDPLRRRDEACAP